MWTRGQREGCQACEMEGRLETERGQAEVTELGSGTQVRLVHPAGAGLHVSTAVPPTTARISCRRILYH